MMGASSVATSDDACPPSYISPVVKLSATYYYDAGLFTFRPTYPRFHAAASFSCESRDVDY